MRAKVIVLVLGCGIAGLALLLLIKPHSADSRNSSGGPATAEQTTPAQSPPASAAGIDKPKPEISEVRSASKDPAEEPNASNHQAYVEARSDQLMDLAMTSERSSFDIIMSELTNRDPQIRKAAVQAAIQYGSRDAIPKLMEVAAQTDDPKEKAEIIEAADYLKLPSLTEVMAARAATGGVVKSTGPRLNPRKNVRPPANAAPAPAPTQ
jgi:hypothetical protein